MSLEERVAAVSGMNIGTVVIDRSMHIADVSDDLLEHTGLEREDLVGRSPIDLVHPDDLLRALAVFDEVQHILGERPAGMYRLRRADGSYHAYAIRATNLGDIEGASIIFELAEPTGRMRAESFADDAVDVMRLLSEDISLDESLDWVARVAERHVDGLQTVITLFESDGPNRVFSRDEVPAAVLELNRTATPEDLPIHVEVAFVDFSQRAWRASRKIASLDFILPGRLTSVLADRDGAIVGYVEALRPTAEPPTDTEWLVHGMISRMMTAALHRHQFDRELRRAADLDPLTGLLNRRKLFEVFEADENLAGSLLYLIDLDRFRGSTTTWVIRLAMKR